MLPKVYQTASVLVFSPFRNYGGVYVGLPAELATVAESQSKSTHKGVVNMYLSLCLCKNL